MKEKMGVELASLSFFLVTLGTIPPLPLTNNLVGDVETPLEIVLKARKGKKSIKS